MSTCIISVLFSLGEYSYILCVFLYLQMFYISSTQFNEAGTTRTGINDAYGIVWTLDE